MNAFKQVCIDLRRSDHTLNEIVKITGRPKASVHFHIKDLPLSARKRIAISRANAIRARQIALRRRGLSAKKFEKFKEWNASTVSLVAHFVFDGEINRRGCVYNNRNTILIKKVESDMKSFYRFEPKRYENTLTGVQRICYFNVVLAEFIKSKARELLDIIGQLPLLLQKEFLSAFFDDEGCMDYRPDERIRRVRGYQKNVRVLYIVQKLLKEFSISSTVKLPNEIVITGKDDLSRFKRAINFSRGVYINGNRSNSIWKKSLEKRELLKRAIASYKPIGSNGVHRTPLARTTH